MATPRIATIVQLLYTFSYSRAVLAAPDFRQPTVTVLNGIIVGTATPLPNQPESHSHELVDSFLGIPYADSPPLRFAPPQPAASWSTPLQADRLKPACIQQFEGWQDAEVQKNVKKIFGTYGGDMPEESEDCLYLNVYAPRMNTKSKSLKPVLLWIYGGNLQFGTASLDRYNGGPLALNNDVIVVTFNYRLNIFGFSNSPELPLGWQNAGFLDQRLALHWVQKNIAAFGGDPKRVLLFGESAGGYSVKQLLANPPRPLPFSAAVMQSQQSGHAANTKGAWERAVLHFDCHDRLSHLRCMREVPANKLKQFIETHYVHFGPVQEDGTSTMDVRKSIDAGIFAMVPILIGSNANEARAFEAFIGMEKSSSLLEFVGKWFHIDTNQLVLHVNAALNKPDHERYHAIDRFLTDVAFTCPSGALAQYLASKGHDVWRYHFSGVFPNMALFGTHPEQGAYHTAEIPMIFGTSPANSTSDQTALSQLMQGIWSTLAKAPANGPGWAKVGENVLAAMGSADGRGVVRTIGFDSIDRDCGTLLQLAEKAGLAW